MRLGYFEEDEWNIIPSAEPLTPFNIQVCRKCQSSDISLSIFNRQDT